MIIGGYTIAIESPIQSRVVSYLELGGVGTCVAFVRTIWSNGTLFRVEFIVPLAYKVPHERRRTLQIHPLVVDSFLKSVAVEDIVACWDKINV
jgi:hypothetical protein